MGQESDFNRIGLRHRGNNMKREWYVEEIVCKGNRI